MSSKEAVCVFLTNNLNMCCLHIETARMLDLPAPHLYTWMQILMSRIYMYLLFGINIGNIGGIKGILF